MKAMITATLPHYSELLSGKSDDDLSVALWSRNWLMPYTDETLKMLGEKGVVIFR
ncbi:Ferrochelatase [Escherichia coli]|nr:Ferrochelatase [Escherichia coli]